MSLTSNISHISPPQCFFWQNFAIWKNKKKKKKKHCCSCMHACKATRETGPKQANERSSERAHFVWRLQIWPGARMWWRRGGTSPGVDDPFSVSPRPQWEIFAHRTAPLPLQMLLLATSFSTSRSVLLHLPRICYYSRSKANKRKRNTTISTSTIS